jgi:hypothetical protein
MDRLGDRHLRRRHENVFSPLQPMCEAERDQGLPQAPTAEALATLLASVGDGLLLDALIDERLDPSATIEALAQVLDLRSR